MAVTFAMPESSVSAVAALNVAAAPLGPPLTANSHQHALPCYAKHLNHCCQLLCERRADLRAKACASNCGDRYCRKGTGSRRSGRGSAPLPEPHLRRVPCGSCRRRGCRCRRGLRSCRCGAGAGAAHQEALALPPQGAGRGGGSRATPPCW